MCKQLFLRRIFQYFTICLMAHVHTSAVTETSFSSSEASLISEADTQPSGTRIWSTTTTTTALPIRKSSSTTSSTTTATTTKPINFDVLFHVDPLYGPVAGGTLLIFSWTSKEPRVNVTGVFIGNSFVPVVAINDRNFCVLTPPSLEVGNRSIILCMPDGRNVTAVHRFTYKPNPNMISMEPTQQITSGGTLVTVFGTGMDSVAEPIIYLTVVVTIVDRYNQTTTVTRPSTNGSCDSSTGSGMWMVCKMPVLDLNLNATQEQEDNSINTTNELLSNQSVNMQRLVSTMYESNRTVQVYMSFRLDGFTENQKNMATQMQFMNPPIIMGISVLDVINIHRSYPKILIFKGKSLTQGCQLIDYHVTIGDANCLYEQLTDDQLSCLPPSQEPKQNSSKNVCLSPGELEIRITVGNECYLYGCSRYVNDDPSSSLIIGVTVGVVGTLVLISVVAVLCLRKHKVACNILVSSNDASYNVRTDDIQMDNRASSFDDTDNSKIPKTGNSYSKGIDCSDDQFDSCDVETSGPHASNGDVASSNANRLKPQSRYVIQISIVSGKYNTLIEGDDIESESARNASLPESVQSDKSPT